MDQPELRAADDDGNAKCTGLQIQSGFVKNHLTDKGIYGRIIL
jgi:hypothetical protein